MMQIDSKAERVFTPLKRYAWLFVFVVAVGGLWIPKLGLFMIPLMVALMIMGFAKGKYWCGNVCPHGSFFDGILLHISRNKKIPAFLRSKILAGMLLAWFMFMLVNRLATVFSSLGEVGFLDRLGFVFVLNYLAVTVLGTVLALGVNPRAWCTICPMGTFQLLLYRLGSWLGVNRKSDMRLAAVNKEDCVSCSRCSRVCPMQLKPYPDYLENKSFDFGACIRCSTCVQHCPTGVLKLRQGKVTKGHPQPFEEEAV